MNQKDPIRESLLASCSSATAVRHGAQLREANLVFSEAEKDAVRALRESETFKILDKGSLDRHDYKHLLSRLTCTPISVCERTATKISVCLGEGLFNESLEWNTDRATVLSEGMASSTSDKQGDDKGMYGLGSGADKSEPKGQADSGTNQKSDHGDHSRTAKKGYMSEEEVKEAKDKAKEAYEAAIAALEAKGKKEMCDEPEVGDGKHDGDDPDDPKNEGKIPDFLKKGDDKEKDENCDMDYPMKKGKGKDESVAPDQAPKANMAPSPTNDGNTAATDATLKHGKKQNESVDEMKMRHEAEMTAAQEAQKTENAHSEKSGSTTADPHKSDPGTGSHGSKSEPGKTGGEADKHDPNYEKVKEEDPAHDPKNKGPSNAKNESFEDAETRLVESLQSKGYVHGTPAWDGAYRRGFDTWLTEHTSQANTVEE